MLPDTLSLLHPDGTIKRILLEDYLRGVVAAALPADAPLEAMKALAVAGRTFAANTHRHTDRGADVCTTRHCQAWNERANPRAARAVMETRGIVASFNDNLIEAFYFDHCDGKTRDAKGVLMDAPAYLKSVPCVCGSASLKGHGIGMCLRGMVAMARLGENYDYILRHYYSGITLAQQSADAATRATEPIAPSKRARPDDPAKKHQEPRRTGPATKPIIKPSQVGNDLGSRTPRRSVATPPPEPEPPPAEPPSSPANKPARQPITPRRSSRQKIEQPEAAETKTPPPPPVPPIILEDAHSPESDDLLSFLAVDDVAPPPAKPKPAPNYRTPRRQTSTPPPSGFPPPPMSMPEEIDGAAAMGFEPGHDFAPPVYTEPPPPFSMPEELPSAGNLDFLAPPTGGMPEDIIPGVSDFLGTPASSIEADLADFMPPVEKFYTPLDAPPTMPEGVPSYSGTSVDETPISWAAPPPLQEHAETMAPPRILMDALPGPRIIAGNLPKAGMLVTIRDARGNSIVTVSGVAKQYGGGGFEAPLTDDGAYQVKFDNTELDLNLQNETVFIYYQ